MESYRNNLSPWAIFDCDSPNNTCIRRFRKRNDADEYLRILRQEGSTTKLEVIFDNEEIHPRISEEIHPRITHE